MKSIQERMRIRNERKEAAKSRIHIYDSTIFKTQGLTYKAIAYIPIKGGKTKTKPKAKAELAAIVGECLTYPGGELGAVSRIHISDSTFEKLPKQL